MECTNRCLGRNVASAALLAVVLTAGAAVGQPLAGGASRQDIQRQERFNELQQIEIDSRLRANEEIPFNERALIDFGGYISAQYISLDDKDHNNHGFWQPELDLYFRYNLDAANEFFVRGQVSYQDFNPGDSFEGRGDEWINPDVVRGYYHFDLARYEAAYHGKTLPYNVVFQAGRDLAYWANGLVLGSVLDGGFVDVSWKNLAVQFIAGVTPVRTVDFDPSRPSFDHNTRRGFYGAMASYNIDTENLGNHKPFLYFVTQRDYNSHDELDQGNIHTGFCYNSWYVGAGTTGNVGDHILYGAEVAYEGGHTLSNSFRVNGFSLEQVQQTFDQIQAMAADFRIDYLVNDRRNTRFGGEIILASGDRDRQFTNTTFAGNAPHTRDNAFNAFGLINTGLAFAPEVSNLAAFRIGAATYPLSDCDFFHRMQLGFDFFVFNKLQKDRVITEKSGNKHYLGVEPDVSLNWQITSDVTLAVRYGIFFPDDNLLAHGFNRQFVYTGLTFAF
jgi:hypothetical protein